jgi:hypothetical protein
MLYYKVEILCSFTYLEQVRLRFQVNPCVDERSFFTTIFGELTREELQQLEKISICQECETDNEVLPLINDCKGKVFLLGNNLNFVDNRIRQLLEEYLISSN